MTFSASNSSRAARQAGRGLRRAGGQSALVHGRIHYTKWTDAAGTDRYGCEIIAEKVDFLSRPKSAENENPELVDRDDEIPF